MGQTSCVHNLEEHDKEIYTIKWSPRPEKKLLLARYSALLLYPALLPCKCIQRTTLSTHDVFFLFVICTSGMLRKGCAAQRYFLSLEIDQIFERKCPAEYGGMIVLVFLGTHLQGPVLSLFISVPIRPPTQELDASRHWVHVSLTTVVLG